MGRGGGSCPNVNRWAVFGRCVIRHHAVTAWFWFGTVLGVQCVYFWFSKPALGGLVCGNHMR